MGVSCFTKLKRSFVAWSQEDDDGMCDILEKEKQEARACLIIQVKPQMVRATGEEGNEKELQFTFKRKYVAPRTFSSQASKTSPDIATSNKPFLQEEDTADRKTEEEQNRAEEGPTERVKRYIPSRDVGFRFSRKSSLEDKHILEKYWEDAYWASDEWSERWELTQIQEQFDWPTGVKIIANKMYFEERLYVQEDLTGRVIRAHHAEIGQIGGRSLWIEMGRWYVFTPQSLAWK